MEIWQKLGYKNDVEYFQRSYAGKKGEVLKKIVAKLGVTHPFYVIKRPIDPLRGFDRYEFKIYDFYHNGVIEKEVITDHKDPEDPVPTIKEWFMNQIKKGTHFKEYIQYCYESHKY